MASIHNPIPPSLIRDLIGLARLLYAAEQQGTGHPVRLQEIADVGKLLNEALELAVRSRPGTMGAQLAWRKAEEATGALGHLVAEERALPLVQSVEGTMLKIKRKLGGKR